MYAALVYNNRGKSKVALSMKLLVYAALAFNNRGKSNVA